MSQASNSQPRETLADVSIAREDVTPISNSLQYAAWAVTSTLTTIDTRKQTIQATCKGSPQGLFDGLTSYRTVELESSYHDGDDASLTVSLFGDDPRDINVFHSVPYAGDKTADRPFLQMNGPNKHHVGTPGALEIGDLLSQVFRDRAFAADASAFANRPFHNFVSAVMYRARATAHNSRIEHIYTGATIDIDLPDLALTKESTPDLRKTDASLHLIYRDGGRVMIRNTLGVAMDVLPVRIGSGGDETGIATLHTTFNVFTLQHKPGSEFAVRNPQLAAKLHIENTGVNLPQQDHLLTYAKQYGQSLNASHMVNRSMQILNDSKQLGLATPPLMHS